MGILSELLGVVERWAEGSSNPYKGQDPRETTTSERAAWFEAANKQPYNPRTTEDIRHALKKRNPARWKRMERDFHWAQRQMKKLGLNPEDARWVL